MQNNVYGVPFSLDMRQFLNEVTCINCVPFVKYEWWIFTIGSLQIVQEASCSQTKPLTKPFMLCVVYGFGSVFLRNPDVITLGEFRFLRTGFLFGSFR